MEWKWLVPSHCAPDSDLNVPPWGPGLPRLKGVFQSACTLCSWKQNLRVNRKHKPNSTRAQIRTTGRWGGGGGFPLQEPTRVLVTTPHLRHRTCQATVHEGTSSLLCSHHFYWALRLVTPAWGNCRLTLSAHPVRASSFFHGYVR